MSAKPAKEDTVLAVRHCLDETPYRMVVYVKTNGLTPLYRVVGSTAPAQGAEKALREAFNVHRGHCFYCRKPIKDEQLSIDHVETVGAGNHLQNLVLACIPCNRKKANRRIEVYDPAAGKEWLNALLLQVQDRLNRL